MKIAAYRQGLAWAALAIAAVMGIVALDCAIAAEPPLGGITRTVTDAKLSTIVITVNKSRTQRINFPFTEVLIGQPDVAEVIPISDQTLYILGKRVGTTNVSLFNPEKKLVGVIDLKVNPETLVGVAPDAVAVEQAVSVAAPGTVNNTLLKSPQQVMLKVRIAEVRRGALRELGFKFRVTSAGIQIGRIGVPGDPPADRVLSRAPLSRGEPFLNAGISANVLGQSIEAQLDALETRDVSRNLAEPTLVTVSGESATFLAGGEFPIPIQGPDGVTVTYKPFGVILNFTPTVLENGHIFLRVAPTVSEISGFLPGTGYPILTARGAATQLEMRDGQSFALAGLLQVRSSRAAEQVPWVGTIPILGALFRSQSFQNEETELVVIVTPHLVKPAKPGQRLKTPLDTTVPANDVDQFVGGDLEIKKRPAANGIRIGGVTTTQYGHILHARPPVAKVQVPAPAPQIAPVTEKAAAAVKK